MTYKTFGGFLPILLALLMSAVSGVDRVLATERSSVKIDKTLFYRQKGLPEQIDNYGYALYYTNGNKLYNLRGFELVNAPMPIRKIRINPAGHTVSAIISNGRRSTVVTYDINFRKRRLAQVKAFASPCAIEYTADARTLAVGDVRTVTLLDAATMDVLNSIDLPFTPVHLAASPDGMMIAAGDSLLGVISSDRRHLIKTVMLPARIVDLHFDIAGDLLGILTDANRLSVFDPHTFRLISEHDVPPLASTFSFHPDGKYVAVNHHGDRIKFMNLMEPADSISLKDAEGRVENARFIRDGKGNDFIVYNTGYSLKYIKLSGFIPNYTKLLETELASRMAEWTRMKPMETEEQYALRVTEETKARKRQLLANEIATGLAGDLIKRVDVTLGGYNPDTGYLTLSLSGMNDVVLTVPADEALGFDDPAKLEFRNAVYALNANDRFELIYADVLNHGNGKTYMFDNLEHRDLSFLRGDDAFIPLELLRRSSMEDVRLREIREEVVASATSESLISDHTHIDVSTTILPGFDEEGNRIKNCKVDFAYTVDPEFSALEDFAPGKYLISDSHAATSMLDLVKMAFADNLKQYLKPGKKLVVSISGSADAMPIMKLVKYDGRFGEFEYEPCYVGSILSSMSVNREEGIRTNPQLAFIRTQAVKHELDNAITALSDMDVTYNHEISVSDETGGEYRRIDVSFLFIDVE